MPDIEIRTDSKEFEYDIYTLVKAFYPASAITVRDNTAKTDKVPDLDMAVRFGAGEVSFTVSGDDKALSKTSVYDETAEKLTRKNVLKKLIYRTLSEYTGRELPWGDLTGIRPVRIPMRLIEEGWRNADIAVHMRSEYFTNSKKTALAIAVANRERDMLKDVDLKNGYSLYIGIPFCPSICLYCSFGSHPIERFSDRIAAYFDALKKELAFIAESMSGRELTSIYIGGGTPTSVSAEILDDLFSFMEEIFPYDGLKEFTLEAGRPDTITEDRLLAALAHGVSRISVNPQTMNDETLRLIGRAHSADDTARAFELARSVGFDDINMDIIAGLPGEGVKEVAYTLSEIEKLMPDSLTVHSLALKRSTRLNLQLDEYSDISFDNSQDIMDLAAGSAMRMNMHPYYLYRQKNIAGNLENVGYAREGAFGLYNVLIMEEKQTIMAAGSGSMSKFVYGGGRIERAPNVKDIDNYIARIDEMIGRKKAALENYLQNGE